MAFRDETSPHLVAWLRTFAASPTRKRCLVVGCGAGDDAEALASAGFEVTAFASAPATVAAAQARFPRSGVDYVVADLEQPPLAWVGAFDLIVEASALEAFPPATRSAAMHAIAALAAPGGRVLVLSRARDDAESPGDAPWPLSRGELAAFEDAGLRATSIETVVDVGAPPVRRFRAFFDRLEG